MIAFAFGIVVGIPVGVGVCLWALYKRGLFDFHPFNF